MEFSRLERGLDEPRGLARSTLQRMAGIPTNTTSLLIDYGPKDQIIKEVQVVFKHTFIVKSLAVVRSDFFRSDH